MTATGNILEDSWEKAQEVRSQPKEGRSRHSPHWDSRVSGQRGRRTVGPEHAVRVHLSARSRASPTSLVAGRELLTQGKNKHRL